ncbi:MAG: PadR family transcriptional regulator [Gemmatimonadetes bacterium]|nr:PadR family transcriptional regulator [Gemmatimonadota bacterium]
MARSTGRQPAELLPLKPDVFWILAVLARGERHGYGILQEAERLSGGSVLLRPGPLYRRLSRLLDEGLLVEVDERPADVEGHDERRRYYRITPFGARVAGAEAERMARALAMARDAGLAPEER